MANSETTAYCDTCKKDVTFHHAPVNHVLHAVITLLTAGLWLPFWLMVAFARGKICNECRQPMWGK